ncbi:tyrosine-type recombinase/integrase [Thalassotalea aquiviva]|uniref:tyrosine-type recombinase/integrase n=1 Tax=Thalassotalea aquiviva TaxID=3242415 RepID=UPI00352A936C
MRINAITPEFIRTGLVCPKDKTRIEFVCGKTPGFFVEVRNKSQGKGTYYLRYKDNSGKTCTVKIGTTAGTKLSVAKAKVLELKAEINSGKSPKEERDKRRNVMTYSEFMLERYLPYAKQHKRTWKNDEQMFNTHLKALFGDCRLNQVTRSAVEKFHLFMRQSRSAATCDHYIKLLRRTLNLAVDWELIESNPISRVKLFRESNDIERYMNDAELARLVHVLKTDANRAVSNIAMFLLSTGARKSEALLAKWEHIDLDNRVWRVPATVAKAKKMRAIPLNDVALGILKSVDTKDTHEFVFINAVTGLPYKCIKKGWTRIRAKAGLPNLRLHDLRHQYASLLVNSGRSLYEVQHILGHSEPKVTQRYAHLSTETLHDAVDAASARLTAASATPSPRPALKLVHSE